MAISKVVYGNETLIDLTSDTVAPDKLQDGYTAHKADGTAITGTAEIAANVVAGLVYQDEDGYLVLDDGGANGTKVRDEDDVIFIDYDGTIVYSYSKGDFAKLTAMPANPVHPGLTAQGWNWTLADAKTQVATYGFLTIGQNYITTDNKTHIDITIESTSPKTFGLRIYRASSTTFSIDWGDGTALTSNVSTTGTTLYEHTYSNIGSYTIKITGTAGNYYLIGSSSMVNAFGSDLEVFDCVKAVRFGNHCVQIGTYAFSACTRLRYVTIPTTITAYGTYAYRACNSMRGVVISSGTTATSQYMFYINHGIQYIAIPKSLVTYANYTFAYCTSLKRLSFPATVSSFGTYLVQYCESLEICNWPTSGVKTVNNYMFRGCHSMKKLVLISNSHITKINTYGFYDCRLLEELDTSSVATYGASDMTYCTSLRRHVIKSGVTAITTSHCQYNYLLNYLTIPDTVTSIGKNAFASCVNLKEVHVQRTTPPTLADTTPFPTNATIYVPKSEGGTVLAAYKADSNWATYAAKLQEEP